MDKNKYIFKKTGYAVLAGCLDAAGYFLSSVFKIKPSIKDEDIRTILIIRLDHLGDVLLSTAVPRFIKESYPKAKILFLTSSYSVPLLEGNPYVDEILLYDAPWFSKNRFKKNDQGMRYFKLAEALRKKNIDLGIALRGDIRENFLMVLADIKKRAGFGITGGGFLLTNESVFRRGVHEREHTLDILRALGINKNELNPEIFVSASEEVEFQNKFSALGLKKNGKYIGLQLCSGYTSKDWSRQQVYKFLTGVSAEFPSYQVVLVGNDLKKIVKMYGDEILTHVECGLNFIEKLNLRELLFLLKSCTVFVGYDSGPAHIASAMGVPTVFLFSGTNNLDEWKPMAGNATVIKNPVHCSPCHLEVCKVEGHPCMAGIQAGRVIEVLKTILTKP